MKEPKDTGLFANIRAFITEYLPGVRNCSRHTVRSYRAALDQFVTYVAKVRKAPLITVTFGDFSAENVTAFLASLESDRGRSIVTRNHRLACLRAFVAYAAGAGGRLGSNEEPRNRRRRQVHVGEGCFHAACDS